jgi:hypothetical protein
MVFATSRNVTIIGIISIVQALAAAALAVFDGNPATNIDFGVLATAITTGVGLVLAKGAKSTGGSVDSAGNPV